MIGMIMAKLKLSNPRNDEIEPIEVEALADTGSTYLCIPESMYVRLKLDTNERTEVTMANGVNIKAPYVGPVRLEFKNRFCYTGALVMGNKVLLGMIPMTDMDLVLLPKTSKIDVNPESPNIAHAYAMGLKDTGFDTSNLRKIISGSSEQAAEDGPEEGPTT